MIFQAWQETKLMASNEICWKKYIKRTENATETNENIELSIEWNEKGLKMTLERKKTDDRLKMDWKWLKNGPKLDQKIKQKGLKFVKIC